LQFSSPHLFNFWILDTLFLNPGFWSLNFSNIWNWIQDFNINCHIRNQVNIYLFWDNVIINLLNCFFRDKTASIQILLKITFILGIINICFINVCNILLIFNKFIFTDSFSTRFTFNFNKYTFTFNKFILPSLSKSPSYSPSTSITTSSSIDFPFPLLQICSAIRIGVSIEILDSI